jgi:hypothetical protein
MVDADAVMLVQTSTPATPIKKSAEGSTHQVLGQALASVDTSATNLSGVLASSAPTSNHDALLAGIFSNGSHGSNGTAAVVSNGQHKGAAGTSNAVAALLSDRQLTTEQAIELAFAGHQPGKNHLDVLWAALEFDPAAVLTE